MDFGRALQALKQGKKVARSIRGGYWFMPMVHFNHYHPDGSYPDEQTVMIMAKLKDGGYAPATPYQADLLAEDWRIVE